MELDNHQRKLLKEGIVKSFTEAGFAMFLDEELDKTLDHIAPAAEPFPVRVFLVIKRAQMDGWIGEFAAAAYTARNMRSEFRTLARDLGLLGHVVGRESVALEGAPGRTNGAADASDASTAAGRVGFLDPAWLDSIGDCRKRVCLVEAERGVATGFLIAPDLVLTAGYVADAATQTPFGCRFDFTASLDGMIVRDGRRIAVRDTRVLDTGETLAGVEEAVARYRILLMRLEQPIGRTPVGDYENADGGVVPRGWFELSRSPVNVGQPVVVYQHPNAGPLRMSVGAVTDTRDAAVVHYSAETQPGSGGGPVVDMRGAVVALHYMRASADTKAVASAEDVLVRTGISAAAIASALERAGVSI